MISREQNRLKDFVAGNTHLMKGDYSLLKNDIEIMLEEYNSLLNALHRWSEAREMYYMEDHNNFREAESALLNIARKKNENN